MGLCLLFLPNFPATTFIQEAMFIPDSRVQSCHTQSEHEVENPIKEVVFSKKITYNFENRIKGRNEKCIRKPISFHASL